MKSDLKFIDDHIKYEIMGASDYLNKAINHKVAGDSANAQVFYNMAMQEIGHIESLMKMHEEHCKKWDETYGKGKDEPNVYKELWNDHHKETKEQYEKLKDKLVKLK